MMKLAKIIILFVLLAIHPTTFTTCPYALYVTPATGLDLVPPHGLPADGYGVFHIVFSKPLRTGVFDEVHAGARTPLPAGINCNIPDVNPTQCYSDPTMPAEIAMTYTVTVYSETGSEYLGILPPTQDVNGNRLSGMVGPISPCLKAAWKDVSTTFTTSAVRFECPMNTGLYLTSGGGLPYEFTGSTTSSATGVEVTDVTHNGGPYTATLSPAGDRQRFSVVVPLASPPESTEYRATATISSSGDGGEDIITVKWDLATGDSPLDCPQNP